MKESQQSKNISYQLKSKFKVHNNSVMCCIILKDGRYASSACDKSIKIFNKKTFKIDINILEHKDYVAYIFQLKDERLVSSSSDNTIKILKIFKNTYNVEQILTWHTKPVKKTIELINGSLVSGSWDKTIKIWTKDENNLYKLSLQFQENYQIFTVFEINDKEFLSGSFTEDDGEEDRAITFYKIKNGEFDIEKIIENLDISAFQSSIIKLNEEILLMGGYKKIYFIDLINLSIKNIYNLENDIWIQSLCLLKEGLLLSGAEYQLLIFKINNNNNNLELAMELNNVQSNNEIINYGVISSIIEDKNKDIMISLYNGEIKIFSKKIKSK